MLSFPIQRICTSSAYIFHWKRKHAEVVVRDTPNKGEVVVIVIVTGRSVMVYHHQPAKLREGHVFSRVCLFTGGLHVTIIHGALDLTL